MTIDQHVSALNALPDDTRAIVLDALRVRAMDFVGDRLWSDAGDDAEDIYRAIVKPDEAEQPFNPDAYSD